MTSADRRLVHGRRLLSLTCVVEALLLLLLLVLLAQALRPDFGGGRFIIVTLFVSIGLLLIATVRDVIAAIIADRKPSSAGTEAVAREWYVALRGLVLILVLFGLMFFVGTIVGMTVVALVILRGYIGTNQGAALAGAVILGVIIPAAFAWAVGMTLWPGLVPEIVPGWIGGGLLPPL